LLTSNTGLKLTLPPEQQTPLLEAAEATPSSQSIETEIPENPVPVSPLNLIIGVLLVVCGTQPLWFDEPRSKRGGLKLQTLAEGLKWSAMEHFLRFFTEKSTRKALLSKDFLLWWFTSPDVAPILAQFAEALKDWEDDLSLHFAGQDQLSDAVQTKDAELLASCAKSLPLIETGTNTFDHEYRGAILMCAMYVRLLAEGSKACIMCFLDPSMFPDIERFLYEFCARTLIMVYYDLAQTKSEFFSTLLGSVFASPMTPEARIEWDRKLGLRYNIRSGSRELKTPSIRLQRAALAFGKALQLDKINNRQFDDRTLEVSEGLQDACP
jgi:hypothetical protein